MLEFSSLKWLARSAHKIINKELQLEAVIQANEQYLTRLEWSGVLGS